MEILYISHCVPWPPDKGDRIRAFHTLSRLVEHHRVHLACLSRSAEEAAAQSPLKARLASSHIEVLDILRAVMRGFIGFARGGSFTTAFHTSPALADYIRSLIASRPIEAAVILSSSMGGYAPEQIPFLADWGDVDSEKRLQYAKIRFPGFVQRLEGLRMRKDECEISLRARRTFLTTPNELQLFASIAPGARAALSGNGVDTDYYDPRGGIEIPADLKARKFLVFVGMMDYFPNVDGVRWFAETVFPVLRAREPDLRVYLVGRNPAREVIGLGRQDGIIVTGAVPDVRPYLAAARAVIAPLRIARGVQNKVLEALAMGKRVLASDAVCRTFNPALPEGVMTCRTPDDYLKALAALPTDSGFDMEVADAARKRFSWTASLDPIVAALDEIACERKTGARQAV